MQLSFFIALLFTSSFAIAEYSNEVLNKSAAINFGAKTFTQKCSLCHGFRGLGEGQVPLLIESYPNTNLSISTKAKTADQLKKVILKGASLPNISQHMPPFEGELNKFETNSLISFIQFLRSDLEHSNKLLNFYANQTRPSLTLGRANYMGRCALCHGINGKGDGRLAKLIKKPPPYNLTKSTKNNAYLSEIIKKGGASMGRSKKMPTWSHLSDTEIESVVGYINLLKQKPTKKENL